jgi:hypothetical protein
VEKDGTRQGFILQAGKSMMRMLRLGMLSVLMIPPVSLRSLLSNSAVTGMRLRAANPDFRYCLGVMLKYFTKELFFFLYGLSETDSL